MMMMMMMMMIVLNHTDVSVTLGNEHIIAEDSVTLLGIIIDCKLDFSDHVTNKGQPEVTWVS